MMLSEFLDIEEFEAKHISQWALSLKNIVENDRCIFPYIKIKSLVNTEKWHKY